MNPAPIFPHQSLLKPKKITQKQLKLHEYYQPCYKDPLSPRPLLLLSESTMQKPLKTYLMNPMNSSLQTTLEEITMSNYPSYSPIDRDHIFPKTSQENPISHKSSITKKKKRKFSSLECKTPISPLPMKKTLREDNFSQISQILTTVLKNPSQSPLNLESYEDFDQNFLDIPIDLTFLSTLQELYLPDPRYLGKTQLNMTYNMRAILMDWMMEVCNDYMLKRQTFHMALNYVDRFLSLSENLPKSKYQLLGVVSLYIAAKLEEIYPPKLEDFALVGHDYPIEEIKGFEQLVLRRLNFRLHPCGVVFWADWLMFQWDMLIEEKAGVPEALFMDLELLQFKQTNESSYKLFRELYQLMDCAILDYNWVKIEGKMFVLGFITLLLWSYMMKIELKGVRERYMEIFIEDQGGVKKMIEEFLKRANNCRLEDFGKGLGFCAGFFGLEMEYDYPMATKINRENVLEGHYGEFLAFQTHNRNNLSFLRKKTIK